jgi:hypothetical protein
VTPCPSCRITNTPIQREPGYFYYLDKEGYLWRSPMVHNRNGTKKKVSTESIRRKKGFLYYLDGEGYVCRIPER